MGTGGLRDFDTGGMRMRRMKQIPAVCLILLVVFAIAGCGNTSKQSETDRSEAEMVRGTFQGKI